MAPDRGVARDRRIRGDVADDAAVSDVDLRIELHATANARRAERARRDGAERTDVHVVLDDDAGEMGDRTRLPARTSREAEPRRPDDRAGRDANACADAD